MSHTHSWQQPGTRLAPCHVIDDWQGMTHGILACDHCDGTWLAWLSTWSGRRLCERSYAVAALPTEAVTTYLANVSRDYCDLTRKAMETGALVNLADKPTALLHTRDDTIVAVTACTGQVPYQPWQEVTAH